MASNSEKVQPLHYITADVQIGSSPEQIDLTASPVCCKFIYGINAEGLTPFEYAISESKIGDKIKTSVKKEESAEFFSQFEGILSDMNSIPDTLFITINIRRVEKAESRDIIKAMAGGSECGCSCGCGGHDPLQGHGHCDEDSCKDHGSSHCRC